jgi:hypothetical protein
MPNGTNNICLVFQACAEKVAEARLTVGAINDVTGLGIIVNPLTGEATAVVGGVTVPISFEFCCQTSRVFFRPTLLADRIVNCGWVNGAILIRNLDTGAILTCINIAATFQEEQEAPGVLPSDFFDEQIVEDQGTAICIVFETNPLTAVTEPVLIVKCIILVKQTVTRALVAVLPTCPPVISPCPTVSPTVCPTVCPPTNRVSCICV